jgi:hypothetical protein
MTLSHPQAIAMSLVHGALCLSTVSSAAIVLHHEEAQEGPLHVRGITFYSGTSGLVLLKAMHVSNGGSR